MFDTSHFHPMLVHFPIALSLLGVLLESLFMYKPDKFHYPCGEILLYFATLSAIMAATAGSLFTPDFTLPLLAQAKDIHSTFAGITVTLLSITSVCYVGRYFFERYSKLIRKVGFVFYLLAAIMVSATGLLGGSIVYNDLLKL